MPKLRKDHIEYLTKRGVKTELPENNYFSDGCHLGIRYLDPEGNPYMDSKGDEYIVRRLFPTGKPKFKAPTGSGSRPYFSPLMPDGYLNDISIPLVFIEGPVKVDACYEHIPTGFCFVGLTGTWNTKDRRDENGNWNPENETRILPELKAIPMRGRQQITLFDSDIEDNISVDEAAADIANWTRQRGAKPCRCTLPSEEDGSKNGADDFLVRHGAQALEDLLQASEVEGWPLPASLLTHEADLKRSYTPAERKRLVKALAQINDVETVDSTCRVLSTKLRIPFSQLLADIDDCRAGTTENGFLGSAEDLEGDDDIDSSWVIPFLLPKEETIVISADPGTGKSLFCYSIAHAVATGSDFLGFPIAKGVPLILQLEEGGTFRRRVKAIGMAKSEFHPGLEVGKDWFFSKTFDLAKGRHVEQLKLLIRNNIDLVIVDSARAVSRSMSIDENHADFGKLVIRRIAKFINDCGKSGIIIHHNNSAGKASGTKDTPAGVWGLFNLKAVEGDEELRTLQTDKKRETNVLWQLRLRRAELIEGLPNGWQWSLESDLSYMAPDAKWRDKFTSFLRLQTQKIGLRDFSQALGLSETEEKSMRVSIGADTACRRWLVEKARVGVAGMYFMPDEYKTQSEHLKGLSENRQGVQTRDTHPLKEIDKTFQVTPKDSYRQGSSPEGTPETGVKPESQESDEGSPTSKADSSLSGPFQAENHMPTGESGHLKENAPSLLGVCLSPPILNGSTDAVLKVINDHPSALPAQLANKIYAALGINLTGAQIAAIKAQHPPITTSELNW